jgi:signal transduction histidine kinase
MAPDSLLLRRLAAGLVVVSIAIVSLLPFTFWLSDALLEDVGVSDLVAHQLITLVRTDALPYETDTARASLHYYRPTLAAPTQLPAELEALAPGIYHELPIGDSLYHVHVRDVGPGDRAYLAYDVRFIENLQASLVAFILALAALAILAVWIFARRVVGRALAPFSELVEQIRSLAPAQRGQRLVLAQTDSELHVIADALNRYMTQLDALVERERAFAAAASHELRTPLSVIQGTAALIAQNSQIPERVRTRLVRAVREVCQDLDALLALSQAREPPTAENIRLDVWLPQVAEAYLSEAQPSAGIRWVADQPVVVEASPGAVSVIFSNLLRNALRASSGVGVLIEITPGQVAICDNGPGIPEEDILHVFEPRFRGRDGGSGMGLYIAKNLADQHGWELLLANREEGGVRATLRFASCPS